MWTLTSTYAGPKIQCQVFLLKNLWYFKSKFWLERDQQKVNRLENPLILKVIGISHTIQIYIRGHTLKKKDTKKLLHLMRIVILNQNVHVLCIELSIKSRTVLS